MQPASRSDALATFLAHRREQQRRAVDRLEAALRDGSDADIVEAAQEVRALGAVAPHVRWEAVYLVEERHRCIQAFRAAIASDDIEASAGAWSSLRGRWEHFLSAEERAAGQAVFQRWGRRLRQAGYSREEQRRE